jgi:hypothetical protein
VRRARAKGWVVSKVKDPTGFPDHVFWVPGGAALIVEFKDPKGRTAKGRAELQATYRKKLALDGYEVHVVDTKEKWLALERRYEDGAPWEFKR